VSIAPRTVSTAANKVRWRNCPNKIHYKSHYDLRISALVPFEVTANYFIFTMLVSGTDFQNTGLSPASDKLAVKYRPGRWNTGHLTTLLITLCKKEAVTAILLFPVLWRPFFKNLLTVWYSRRKCVMPVRNVKQYGSIICFQQLPEMLNFGNFCNFARLQRLFVNLLWPDNSSNYQMAKWHQGSRQ